MTPVNTAIWYIESHLREPLTLESISNAVGVSRFHLSRAFAAATGMTIMAYARTRRMAEAAKVLMAGAPDILSVALGVGYSSHEAFSRAFNDTFHISPTEARNVGTLKLTDLQEPILMDDTLIEDLGAPRFEDSPALHITGLAATYSGDASAGIPEQWQRFVSHLGNIPGQQGDVTYGVCAMDGEAMTYMCGVQTSDTSDVPGDLSRMTLAPQRYAAFRHKGHISEIRRTWATIFEQWMPTSGVTPADAPDLEWYSADFDPMAGTGYVEIWIPIEA